MIRRDQCPIAMKIQEKALQIIFETKDITQLKSYLIKIWSKIYINNYYINIKDFIFNKEVKYNSYVNMNMLPPGAIIISKLLLSDPMAIPPTNWRVPYIVVHVSNII